MQKQLSLFVISALLLFTSAVAAETAANEDSVLPRGVLAAVKTGSLKELSDKIMVIARQIEQGPQVESMPFLLGAMIGDPMLQGVEVGQNIGIAYVRHEGNYHPVLVARLTETSPYRQSLQGYGLRLSDHQGWTFGTMGELEPAALGDLRGPLTEWARIPRRHDIELEFNGPEISRFVLEIEDEIRAAIRSGVSAENAVYEEAAWAVLKTLAGEFKVLSSIGVAIGLEEDAITQYGYLEASGDTALGRFFSADHTASVAIADWIGSDRPILFVGRANPSAILDYIDYFSNKAVVSGGEALEAGFRTLRELIALQAEHGDGNVAGAFGFEGTNAKMVQITNSRFDDEGLREFLRNTVSVVDANQGILEGLMGGRALYGGTTTTDLLEDVESIGDYPVHGLRSRTDFGGDEEISGEEGTFFAEMNEQVVYYVQVKDYLLTASDLGELREIVRAIDADERPAGGARGLFREEPGLAGQWIINPDLFADAMQGFLPGIGSGMRDLPPMTGETSMKDNGARAKLEIPVTLIAGLVREAQALASGLGQGAIEFEPEEEREGEPDPDPDPEP